jgi:hypothetical protein
MPVRQWISGRHPTAAECRRGGMGTWSGGATPRHAASISKRFSSFYSIACRRQPRSIPGSIWKGSAGSGWLREKLKSAEIRRRTSYRDAFCGITRPSGEGNVVAVPPRFSHPHRTAFLSRPNPRCFHDTNTRQRKTAAYEPKSEICG